MALDIAEVVSQAVERVQLRRRIRAREEGDRLNLAAHRRNRFAAGWEALDNGAARIFAAAPTRNPSYADARILVADCRGEALRFGVFDRSADSLARLAATGVNADDIAPHGDGTVVAIVFVPGAHEVRRLHVSFPSGDVAAA